MTCPIHWRPAARAGRGGAPRWPKKHPIPEMVGATDQPIVLTGRTASASVPVTAPAGPGRSRGAAAAPGRVYLNIENITGDG